MSSRGTEEAKSFRDKISTVSEEGKRVWVYPKKPKGRFYNRRKWVSYGLLAFLFAAPFIYINGQPMLMFNILERKFVIFFKAFYPQDFFIFALLMITGVVSIILFTVIFGRLFCGWVCPQTIFMEMVFRRIEYWIEGDYKQQKYLDKQLWTKEKVLKKTAKQGIFWGISFIIANLFLVYIIGRDQWISLIMDPPSEHLGGFISMLVFTTIFYLVFSKFREQVCTVVCPYGRLQGVLLDRKSIVVAYDHKRGEKRALFRKNEDREAKGKGDCIDCHQCVDVCPTGIDIRNGTQLECVNCTACIDACDHIMDSIKKPKGLIRYASEDEIEKKEKFKFTGRMKAYSAILVLLLTISAGLIISRKDVDVSLMRTRGTLYQTSDEGNYTNIYDVTFLNKSNDQVRIDLKIIEGKGTFKWVGNAPVLEGGKELESKFIISVDKENVESEMKFVIGVYKDKEEIDRISTKFIGPEF